MQLRSYQNKAIDDTFAAWESNRAVLGVAATGLGKTVIFASIVAKTPGRVMIVAHREELIFQAADKIKQITGVEAGIEMADMRAACAGHLAGPDRVVISTIQTQNAGRKEARMARFDPMDFDLLVIDEAHHATAASYRRVIEHYKTNPQLKVFGVTATPDRADEEALGQVFDTVAFDFDIRFGINEGWLVPIEQRAVHVTGVDLTSVRTTAGDLNGADLARVMENESALHAIASPTIALTEGKKTLVFASSLAHAELLTEILNRHKQNSAAWISGDTDKDARRGIFKAYADGHFQYLVNVGVATEGFDDPGIEAVVMARPTKSRSLYAQMIGRGTRTLPGTVDGIDDNIYTTGAAMRREAIAASGKPHVQIIDFVGNAGRHHLATTTDILAGNYTDEVIERAQRNIEKAGGGNAMQALEEAEEELTAEHEAERKKQADAEAARRAKLTVGAQFKTSSVDPFDVLHIEPWREKGWDKGKKPSPKMLEMLERNGIKTEGITYTQAKQLIAEICERFDSKKATYKQSQLLARFGYPTDITFAEARKTIDAIVANGWKRPDTANDHTTTTTTAPAIDPARY